MDLIYTDLFTRDLRRTPTEAGGALLNKSGAVSGMMYGLAHKHKVKVDITTMDLTDKGITTWTLTVHGPERHQKAFKKDLDRCMVSA